jgi:ABC-type lipoprotein release transport system permease subunit
VRDTTKSLALTKAKKRGNDPVTFIGGAIFPLAVAMAASAIPASRATRIDPAQLLRQE